MVLEFKSGSHSECHSRFAGKIQHCLSKIVITDSYVLLAVGQTSGLLLRSHAVPRVPQSSRGRSQCLSFSSTLSYTVLTNHMDLEASQERRRMMHRIP